MEHEPASPLRTRRGFIRQAACAALGTWAITRTLRDLRLINTALAQSPPPDYRALVCIFLSGGNDANNLVVPTSPAEYQAYANIRQNLALPQSSLLPIPTLDGDGREYGLHPVCPELQTLFAEGKLALLFNVGTLVRPVTRSQYLAGGVELPPQLFSHSDQVTQWQTSIPDQPPATGWGGRCADLINSVNIGGQISMSVSLAGANTFEVGHHVQQYHVSTSGAVTLSSVTGAHLQAMKDILGLNNANLQRSAYADVVERAIATGDLLNSAISPTSAPNYFAVPFPNTSLGNQLKMIARLIAARGPTALNMKRQIFFASVGGYDTHTAQITDPTGPQINPLTGSHADLLNELSESLFAFQRAMEQIGASEGSTLPDQVTAFTASDFGRTFPTNGQGSDHGWGNHQIVVGGAVRGRRTYGRFPSLAINGPDDTSTGRWIPTTSVDEYSATLAKWFGVGASDLLTIFPNLDHFANPDLGFLK